MRTVACVTGKLAEPALREVLAGLEGEALRFEVVVLPITVAALMTTEWIAARLAPPPDAAAGPGPDPAGGPGRPGEGPAAGPGPATWDEILIPGLCQGDLEAIRQRTGLPVKRGPKDLKDLPRLFGRRPKGDDYGFYDALIFAEIHAAPGLSPAEIIRQAEYYRASGADVIDLGGVPGQPWREGPAVIAELKQLGFTLSLDSMNPEDLTMGLAAGVDYLLSAHPGQYEWARESRSPVVIVPDQDSDLDAIDPVVEALARWGVPYILDPILSPINFGFADSLHRFVECRRRYPEAPMMLGAHHLTELLDADTTGVNAVIMGFAQELSIRHILTTEVVSWARGAVRELDCARRLMAYSHRHRRLPKYLEEGLLALKDPSFTPYQEDELRRLQAEIRDSNFRIFTDRERIYVFNTRTFVIGQDPQEIFDQLGVNEASHAFYLGKELMKAKTAITLGKRYQQEQPLHWGYRTTAEQGRHGRVRLTHARRHEQREGDL